MTSKIPSLSLRSTFAMHSHLIAPWQHLHTLLGERNNRREQRMSLVLALTTAMMVVEILKYIVENHFSKGRDTIAAQ
jgi:Co/Zn/Cd efflux system component